MKSIKMLGLAAIAALMAMALVSVSSAMAENTALCKADENPCSEANGISHVHEATLSGAKAKLLTSAATVECDVLFLGDTLGEVGESASVIIHGHFTYTNCKRGTENCTATETSTDSLIEVLKLGHETADVTGLGEVNVHCGFIINCTYDGTNLNATAKGPLLSSETNGSVELSEQAINHVSGLFCPATAKLDITTTPLAATYISAMLHYCVEFEHESTGRYLDPTCTENDVERKGKFGLVSGPAGGAVGGGVCVNLPVKIGLYKNGTCTEDDAANKSLYEKGTIKKVE